MRSACRFQGQPSRTVNPATSPSGQPHRNGQFGATCKLRLVVFDMRIHPNLRFALSASRRPKLSASMRGCEVEAAIGPTRPRPAHLVSPAEACRIDAQDTPTGTRP
jgi:hypothetical protein